MFKRISVAAVVIGTLVTVVAAVAAGGRVFHGDGGKTLAPFSVTSPSTLRWTNNGGLFQIFAGGASTNGSVNSQASSGWTYAPKGRYSLQVNAVGSWTIRIVPGIVRPRRSGGWASYTGNGGMQLPPFKLPRSEQVYWTAKGGIFQIFSPGFTGISVNSQASHGSTYGTAGTQNLQINTTGPWTLRWRP